MSRRIYHLERGDTLWAPRSLVWGDPEVDWVEFNVIANEPGDTRGQTRLVTLEYEGEASTHVLDAEIGICD